jgi:hypothetical protein
MLCEAARHASRPTHPLHPYFATRCAKRGYKMVTIAVAHRLARITFAMLRDGTDFFMGGTMRVFALRPTTRFLHFDPTTRLPAAFTSPPPLSGTRRCRSPWE